MQTTGYNVFCIAAIRIEFGQGVGSSQLGPQPDLTFTDHVRSPLPPPRYSLRTLLLFVTIVSLLLGLTWWVSPIVIAATMLVLLTIAAHVAGNAIGTQLRNRATHNDATAIPHREHPAERPERRTIAYSPPHAPTTHLGERWSLGWTMIIPTALGALCSMIAGCVWMRVVYQGGIDAYGTALAVVAFGVLGGFATFGLTTFLQVTAVAFWQALNHK